MTGDQPITQRIAAKAVIVNDEGRILVLREANTYEEGTNIGRYHLPGGRINPGEPFLEGLTREIKEESGLEVSVGEPLYIGEWWPVIKGNKNQIVGMFFLCKPLHQNVQLSEEHDDFQWITPDEAGKYDIMDPEDKVIQAYAKMASAIDSPTDADNKKDTDDEAKKQRRRKLLLS